MSTGTLYEGDIAAHSPYEQPVAHITNVTLVVSRPATAQRVHAVSPTQLLQCLGRVFDDEIDYLSQWRIIDVFLRNLFASRMKVFVNWVFNLPMARPHRQHPRVHGLRNTSALYRPLR